MRDHTRRQVVYIKPIILCAVSRLFILVKSIENRFSCLLQSSRLDRLASVVYSIQVYQIDLTRIDDQSLFWFSLLDRLPLQVYFSQVCILALLVNFIRVSIYRLASRVYIFLGSTLSLEREILASLVYFLILHPGFASLFQLSI